MAEHEIHDRDANDVATPGSEHPASSESSSYTDSQIEARIVAYGNLVYDGRSWHCEIFQASANLCE